MFIRVKRMFGVAGALQKLGVTLPGTETKEHKTGYWNLFSRFHLRDYRLFKGCAGNEYKYAL